MDGRAGNTLVLNYVCEVQLSLLTIMARSRLKKSINSINTNDSNTNLGNENDLNAKIQSNLSISKSPSDILVLKEYIVDLLNELKNDNEEERTRIKYLEARCARKETRLKLLEKQLNSIFKLNDDHRKDISKHNNATNPKESNDNNIKANKRRPNSDILMDNIFKSAPQPNRRSKRMKVQNLSDKIEFDLSLDEEVPLTTNVSKEDTNATLSRKTANTLSSPKLSERDAIVQKELVLSPNNSQDEDKPLFSYDYKVCKHPFKLPETFKKLINDKENGYAVTQIFKLYFDTFYIAPGDYFLSKDDAIFYLYILFTNKYGIRMKMTISGMKTNVSCKGCNGSLLDLTETKNQKNKKSRWEITKFYHHDCTEDDTLIAFKVEWVAQIIRLIKPFCEQRGEDVVICCRSLLQDLHYGSIFNSLTGNVSVIGRDGKVNIFGEGEEEDKRRYTTVRRNVFKACKLLGLIS